MKNKLIKSVLITSLLTLIMACQQSNVVSEGNADMKKPLPNPCKKYTSPPLKDKSKIKEMLIKEGKINSDLSEAEINTMVNEYIQRKQTAPCKSTSFAKSEPLKNSNGE